MTTMTTDKDIKTLFHNSQYMNALYYNGISVKVLLYLFDVIPVVFP